MQPPLLGPRHTLQDRPTSPLMSQERPFVGFPRSQCPSISRTRTAEGTILARHTSCPEAAAGQVPGVLTVPLCHFPGSEEQGCLPSSLAPIILAPEKPSVPPSLALSHHLDRSAPCRSSQVSCMLPASGPTPPHAWPSQQVLSCERPNPTRAWPPSHPYLQAQPGPKYSFLPSSARAESVNKAT